MNSVDWSPLVVIRHGQTTWNTSRLVQGHNDEAELTERGRQQVAEVAKTFRPSDFDLIVSSDLRRAVDTAAILADDLGLEVEIDELLRERDFGVAEGGSLDDLTAELVGISDSHVTDENVSPDGGETLRAFRDRAERFLTRRQRQWPNQRLLVVTHGGTIRALRRCYEGTPFQGSIWDRIDNCAVFTLTTSATA